MKQFSFDISLAFNEDSKMVLADLIPGFDAPALTMQTVQSKIELAGYKSYFQIKENVEALVWNAEEYSKSGQRIYQELSKRAAQDDNDEDSGANATVSADQVFSLIPNTVVQQEIAEQKDGKVDVSISEDEMEVYLIVTPPFGGKVADAKDVYSAVTSLNIKAEINDTAIENAIEAQEGSGTVIAKGTPPRKGRDSSFKALVNPQITTTPVIDEKGIANYLDINDFVVVEPDTPLMKRLAPKPGKPGKDVFAKVIPAETGEILPFDTNLEGAQIDPNDGNQLIATIKGHPIILERGVSIDPVLQLPNVSLATGNVDYDGTVVVKGDVSDGMTVNVSGDLIVNGVVGKATITAGNDVVIQQGLIGGMPSERDDNAGFGAHIEAKGSVSIRFANKGKINAGKNISIREYASYCDLRAKDKVLIGEESGKGTLIGGTTRAFNLVSTKIMGSPGGAITEIRVGAAEDTVEKLRKTNYFIKQRNDTISELEEELQDIEVKSQKMDLSEHLLEKQAGHREQVKTLREEIESHAKESDKLKDLLMRSKRARVAGRYQIYQNVRVSILGSSYPVKEDMTGGQFRFDARKVVFER